MSPVVTARYRLRQLARTALAAWCAAACSTWSGQYDEPPLPGPGRELHQARLNLRDGRSLVVYQAHVRPDSVVGQVWRHGYQPIGVARSDVLGIQVREVDAVRTTLLIAGIVTAVVWTIALGFRRSFAGA